MTPVRYLQTMTSQNHKPVDIKNYNYISAGNKKILSSSSKEKMELVCNMCVCVCGLKGQ